MSVVKTLPRRLRTAVTLARRQGLGAVLLRSRQLGRSLLDKTAKALRPTAPAAEAPYDLAADYSQSHAVWRAYLAARGLAEQAAVKAIPGVTFIDIAAPDWKGAVRAASPDGVLLFADGADEASTALAAACSSWPADQEMLTFDGWRVADGRAFPLFAYGANPTALRAVDYLYSRFALRARAAQALVGDPQVRTPYDLLRAWLDAPATTDVKWRWRHDSRPLLRLAIDAGDVERVRREALARRPPAWPRVTPGSVSVIICSKDKGRLLDQIVRQVRRAGGDRIAKVVIVSNNTVDPNALEVHDRLVAEGLAEVLRHDAPFNFSRQTNLGAAVCDSEFLLLLNDDIIALSDDWLDPLFAAFADPTVGIAGPMLLYPNERLQHVGLYTGYRGLAGHVLRAGDPIRDDYQFATTAPREVSAVTGAVMAVRTSLYRALSGLDEGQATYLQDVDICLRARRMGRRMVHTPQACLLHLESISAAEGISDSRMLAQRQRERDLFLKRWSGLIGEDPFFSPNFDIDLESMRKLRPPRAQS